MRGRLRVARHACVRDESIRLTLLTCHGQLLLFSHGVGRARASAKDKPLHENYAKGLEAEKKKVNFHAMRRGFHKSQEEQKEEAAPALAPVSKWAKPSVRSRCTHVADMPVWSVLVV